MRSRLRRWHVWLGWIVGLPILFWTVSGLVMVWKPIEEVRGTHLMREPAVVRMPSIIVPPAVSGIPLASLSLEHRAPGPRWVISLKDGTTRLADPATGRLLPPLSAADAVGEIVAHYRPQGTVQSIERTDAANPPLELRRPIAAWNVTYSDGTSYYVDISSGKVVAARTGWWRFYDWMWGIHIMDLDTREDTHNPWVLGFGLATLVMSLLALLLLPTTIRRRRGDAR